MFTVVITPTAEKKFNRLPKNIRTRVLKALEKLRSSPKIGKPLMGEYQGFFTLRVWPYRVIYKIIRKQLVVEVVDVGHRQGIYQ